MSIHDYLSGSFFDLTNQSQLTDHFNQLTLLTNLQYITFIYFQFQNLVLYICCDPGPRYQVTDDVCQSLSTAVDGWIYYPQTLPLAFLWKLFFSQFSSHKPLSTFYQK